MNETLKKYYEYLRGTGADAPDTFESFSSTLEDPQNSEKYFNYLQASGFDTPKDYDSFVTTLGLKKKDEPAALPTIQEDIYGVSRMPADYLQQPSEEKPKEPQSQPAPAAEEEPLKYDDTLPESFMPEAYISAAARKNKYYEQRGKAITDKFESDVRALEAAIDTTEDPKAEFEKLRDRALSDIKKLEGDFDTYQWIDKDHVKQIRDEVLNIIQLPGTTTEQKHAALNELKQYFMNAYTSNGADGKAVEGELNDIIGRRAMFTGTQPTTFALKSQALEAKEKLRVAREKLLKEIETVQPTYTVEGIAIPKSGAAASKYDDLQRSLRRIELAEKNLSTAMRMPEASKGAGVEAFRQELANIASVGVAGLAEVLEVTGAAKKQREGTATEIDEALIDSYGQLQQLRSVAQEEVDRYRRASSVAGSIPYMEQFILTGGVGRVAVGTAEKAVASVLKNRVKSAVMRGIAERTIAPVVEGAISTIGRVPLSPATYKNIAEMRLPLKQENGKYVIDPAALPSMAKAIAVGTGRSAAEIFSESLGGVVALPKWKAVNRIISPSAQRIFKTVGLNNPFGEYTEEFFANWLQGEAVFKDPEFLKDLALTIPVMTAGFAVLASPEVAKDMMWKADAKAVIDKFGRENIADLRKMIEAKDEAGIVKKIMELSEDANGKQLTKLIEYTGSLVQNRVVDEMTVGEQKPIETGGVKDAESVGVKTEEAGAEAAPGMVEGEEGRVDLRDTAEDRVEAEPREVTVERTEEGDTMAMAAPVETPPTPEVKQQVRDEIARLNALSGGQQVVAVEGGVFPEDADPRVPKAFAKTPGMLGIHMPGDTRSYINVDNITSVEEARNVWLHEAGVHGGIERLFKTRDAYDAAMTGVIEAVGEEVALKTIDEQGGSRQFYEDRRKSLPERRFKSMLGEEYLGFISNKIITDPSLRAERALSTEELNVWQKFVKALHNAVAQFMGTPMKLSDADIANLVIDATRTAMAKEGVAPAFRGAKKGEAKAMAKKETIETPKGTKIIVAPFYDTKIESEADANELRKTEAYKQQQQQIKDVAEIMGIKIKDVSENIGGFVNEQGNKIIEISNTITIDGTIEQAEDFAAVMGVMSHEAQESSIAKEYLPKGSTVQGYDEISIKIDNIDGTIESLKAVGLNDYTINQAEGTVQIIDFSQTDAERIDFRDKIANFVRTLKDNKVQHGEVTKRRIDSRYIDSGPRTEILGRVRSNPVYIRQGGAGFRLLMERTALREKEFGIRKRGEARGEVIPDGVVRNVAKSLGLTFPDVKVIVGEDNRATREAVVKALEEAGVPTAEAVARVYTTRWFKGFRGKAVSWKGKPILVFINEELSTPNTIGHEMWHLILRNAFGDNAPLFKEFVGSVDAALRERGYGEVADSLKSFISSGAYETAQQYEEYLAQLGGYLTMGAIDVNTLSKGKTLIEQIRDILNRFARALVGRDIFLKDATADNILDFMTAISQRMAKGESVSEFLTGAEPKSKGDIEIRSQATEIFSDVLSKLGIQLGTITKSGKVKVTNYEVASALNTYYKKIHKKIKFGDFSDTAVRVVADYATAEVAYALSRFGENSGQGWYTEDYDRALDILEEIYPGIKSDPQTRELATIIISIASNSTDVSTNLARVLYALESYKNNKDGHLPMGIGVGKAMGAIDSTIRRYNNLLDLMDGDAIAAGEFLRQEAPLSELKKIAMEKFGVKTMTALKQMGVATDPEWNDSEVLPMSVLVFGPKIGVFYSNLSGLDGAPTVDRWCIRTIYRYRGDMRSKVAIKDVYEFAKAEGIEGASNLQVLKKAKEFHKIKESILQRKGKYAGISKEKARRLVAPFNRGHAIWDRHRGVVNSIEDALGDANVTNKDAYKRDFRSFTRRVFELTQEDMVKAGVKLSISDIQAILWLFEKRLFSYLGVAQRPDSTYSAAAATMLGRIKSGEISIEALLRGDSSALANLKGKGKDILLEDGPMGEMIGEDVDSMEDGLIEMVQRNTEESEISIKPSIASSPEIKRIKNHIRKMVLQAHGVDIMEKRAQAAYDIGAAEEKLIRNIEEGKDKAAKKRALETYRQLSKFISRAIKEAAFATKLSRVQTRMIVNEARRVKDFDTLQDFFSTLDKIVDNTQYAAAMNNARTAQREIRKRVASGRYGKDAQMVLDFATMPLRVRDFEIEDLDEFNRIAELLLAGKVPADGVTALRSYKPPKITEPLKVGLRKMINEMDGPEDFEKVFDAISDLDVSSLAKFERALEAVSMARERLAEMSGEESDLGEMEDRLDDLESNLESKVKDFAEELEEEKMALIEESKTLAEDVELESFYPEERIEVKKILDMRDDELMRMTPKQVFLYRDIVRGLTEGFVNKEMYAFIQEMDVTLKRASWGVITAHLQGGYQKIRELGDKFAKANMRFIAKWIDPLRINEDFLTNVFNLSKMNVVDQKVLGIYDKNVKPIYENFVAPLMRAVTTMDRDVEHAMNQYYAATKKVSKEEREMLGMLMAERDYRSGSIIIGGQEYIWDDLPTEEKKDLFRWAAENRSKSMRHDVADIMRVRKEMVMDEQGNIDIDASLKKMIDKNPAVAKLMAASRAIIDSQKGKARVSAEMRGDVFEDEGPDYFPRLVAESLNRQDPKMIEKGNIDSMTSPYRAVRKRAKSSFNRTHERHVTEYDLDRVIGFYVYDVNRDYHLSRPITAISVALHRVAATSEVEDSAQVAAALRRSIVDRIKVELTERSKIPVLSKLVNWKRTLALAQPERPMIEFTANAIRYYAENPSARASRITDSRWKAVARLMASPISLKRLSRYDSELMTEEREGFLERGAKLLYTAADTYAGRLVYGNEFDKAFKEKTGEKLDLDKFIADEQYRIDNKEALAHADAMAMNMIESLYNSQSWATGPSKHRYLPGTTSKEMLSSKKSFIAQTLGYMQSFNFGETEEALNAIRAIVRPGVSSGAKARAGRRLLNLMVTNYIYMAMRGAFFVMLNAAIDDEDDMMESLANYFSFKNQWKMFVGSAATLGMGRHGALVRLATSVGLGFADYANEDSESLRLIVDTANQSINARPINPNKRMKFVDFVDQVGMIWGDIAADLARMGMSAVDLYKQVSEKGIDSLTLDQKETWVALSTMNQILALAVPNFVSPVAERVIRAFRYSVGPDYQIDPDKKARTVNGTDIKDLYKLAPVSGMTSKAITVYSTGERMDSKREISDGELKKYQSLAREKFNAYVREYTVNNRGVIAAEAQAGSVSDARSDEVQKDINELWKRAKKQAQIELYEYPSAKRHPEYVRVVKYGALPEPVSEAERTDDGERVNMMMDPELAKEVNKTFIRLYLDWFSNHYATEAAVKAAKREIGENGKSKFDNEVNEAVRKLRAEAKSQHLK